MSYTTKTAQESHKMPLYTRKFALNPCSAMAIIAVIEMVVMMLSLGKYLIWRSPPGMIEYLVIWAPPPITIIVGIFVPCQATKQQAKDIMSRTLNS